MALGNMITAVNGIWAALQSGIAATVAGLPPSTGQKTAANSTSVVLASDQGAVPVSGSVAVSNLPANPAPVAGNLLPSAARTATTNSSDIINTGYSAIVLYFKVTAGSGGTGMKINIQNKSASGDYYSIVSGTMTIVNATGSYEYVYGIYVQTTNGFAVQNTQQCVLGSTFRVQVVHTDSASFTYSLDYDLIP